MQVEHLKLFQGQYCLEGFRGSSQEPPLSMNRALGLFCLWERSIMEPLTGSACWLHEITAPQRLLKLPYCYSWKGTGS